MKRIAGLLCSATMLLALPCLAEETAKPKVAVMEFAAKSGVSQDQADALNDLVASQIADIGKYQVITKADIESMLTMEQQKIQLTGCADDACLAEIGGALGVNLLVSGNLAQFGEVFLINLRLVDAKKAQAVARSSARGQGRSVSPAQRGAAGRGRAVSEGTQGSSAYARAGCNPDDRASSCGHGHGRAGGHERNQDCWLGHAGPCHCCGRRGRRCDGPGWVRLLGHG